MAIEASKIELALGPVYFNWSPQKLEDFYDRIANEAPIARVHIGEIVCGKRSPLNAGALARSAERLRQAGKTVVWSGLIAPVNKRERGMIRDLIATGDEIEVNEMGGMTHLKGQPFTAGPFLNLYNENALALMARLGCTRWCARVELPLNSIRTMARALPTLGTELFGFGRLPLAHSGRCYHARQHGLTKDSCQYVCDRDPDGASIETLDGEPLLAYNGVQTLSHSLQVCSMNAKALSEAGVRALRLSPHDIDMVAVAEAFRDHLDGKLDSEAFVSRLVGYLPGWPISNGYLSGRAGREWVAI